MMPTHQQGSKPIDGILISKTLLEEAKGGFLDFGDIIISNHHAIWLDTKASPLGMDWSQDITRQAGQRLKCQDPCIVKKYNAYLNQETKETHFLQLLKAVYKEGVMTLSTRQIKQLEILDQAIKKAKREVEKQCRKMQAGCIPWTPGLTITIYQTLYWQGIRKCISGGTISGKVLRKQAKLGVEKFSTTHLQMSQEAIHQKLWQAHKTSKQWKGWAISKTHGSDKWLWYRLKIRIFQRNAFGNI